MSFVEVVHDGFVAQIVLSRVDAHNALSTAMMAELERACARIADDAGIRVAVLASADPAMFCVGADLKERAGLDLDGFMAQRTQFQRTFAAVRDLPMPAIAAVHGFALGGGFELALSCDLVVGDESTVVGLPEVGLGIVPGGGGTQLVARRAGSAVAADLLFTARRVGIDEAERLRLVDRRAAVARTGAMELADAIAAQAPVAVRQAKLALRIGVAEGLAAGLAAEDAAWRTAIAHPQRAEGVAAFAAKRRPHWPG